MALHPQSYIIENCTRQFTAVSQLPAAYTGKEALIPPAAAVLPTVSSFSFKNSAESPLRRICTRKALLFAAGGGKLTSPYMVPDVQAAFYGFGKRSRAFYNFMPGYSIVGSPPALEICILPVLEMDAFLAPLIHLPPLPPGIPVRRVWPYFASSLTDPQNIFCRFFWNFSFLYGIFKLFEAAGVPATPEH